jgi:hypothetical protein
MSQIIAFTGKLGSGKDTAADRFERIVSHARVARGSFARKLKQSATYCWGDRFDVQMWETWKNDPTVKVMIVKEDPTVGVDDEEGMKVKADILVEEPAREFLQHYGTKAHRGVFSEDFWVEQAFENLPPYDILLFTDCRFDNEAEMIRAQGGKIVKVFGLSKDTGGHVSEAGISPHLVDFEVHNHVRDDNFKHLDYELEVLTRKLFLPSYLTV